MSIGLNLPSKPTLTTEELIASVVEKPKSAFGTPEREAFGYYAHGVNDAAALVIALSSRLNGRSTISGQCVSHTILLNEGLLSEEDTLLSHSEYVRGFATCVQTLLLTEKKKVIDTAKAIVDSLSRG